MKFSSIALVGIAAIVRMDMFVFDKFVVELKAIKEVTNEHFAIVRSYLKAARQRHGLILNFAKPILEIKRVIFTE